MRISIMVREKCRKRFESNQSISCEEWAITSYTHVSCIRHYYAIFEYGKNHRPSASKKNIVFFWKRNLTIKILAFAWANKSLLYGNGRDHHICASTVQMFAGVECVRASVTTPRWARNRTFSSPAPRCVGSDDCTSHAESHYSNLRTYKSTDSSKSHRDRSTMWIDIPHKSYNVVLCCVEASNE